MADINWDELSLDELKDIQKKAAKAIGGFKARRCKQALAAAEMAAAELGFSLGELTIGAKRKVAKTAPKYRNPENPAKTWTGRGRQPVWFKEALASGKTPTDLLISA